MYQKRSTVSRGLALSRAALGVGFLVPPSPSGGNTHAARAPAAFWERGARKCGKTARRPGEEALFGDRAQACKTGPSREASRETCPGVPAPPAAAPPTVCACLARGDVSERGLPVRPKRPSAFLHTVGAKRPRAKKQHLPGPLRGARPRLETAGRLVRNGVLPREGRRVRADRRTETLVWHEASVTFAPPRPPTQTIFKNS